MLTGGRVRDHERLELPLDMPSKKHTEAVRVARVRQLFEARAAERRNETAVLLFYAWLEKYHPELLPAEKGDPYQQLKVDLKGLYEWRAWPY